MAALASPVFATGPKDPVSIVDVYETAAPEVRNNLTSKLSSFGSSLNEVFGASMTSIRNLGHNLASGRIDPVMAAQRIQGALSGSRGDIISLATSAQNAIFSELTGTVPGTDYVRGATELYDSVNLVVGNGSHRFQNGSIQSVRATLGFISDLTGNPVFKALDLGAEAALLRGIIGEVSAWGIPDLVDSVLEGRDDQFRFSVVSRASDSILQVSNIGMLEYYINKGLASALVAKVPNYADQFISQYAFPQETTPGDYVTLHAQFMNVMNALSSTWLYTHRGGVSVELDGQTIITPKKVFNLTVISRASQDAYTLLISDPVTRPAMICARNYPTVDVIQLTKRMYPLIGIVRNS